MNIYFRKNLGSDDKDKQKKRKPDAEQGHYVPYIVYHISRMARKLQVSWFVKLLNTHRKQKQ